VSSTVPDTAVGSATERSERLRVLAWAMFSVAAAVALVGTVAMVSRWLDGRATTWSAIDQLAILAPAGSFSVVGLVVALRKPANPAGWLMLVIGAAWSLVVFPTDPGPASNAIFSSAPWVIPFGLMGTHLLLRLPNGQLLTPRWRWVSRASTVAIVTAAIALPSGDNPPVTPRTVVGTVGLLLLMACIVSSVASLVLRARRSGPDERHQIRWIATGAVTFLAAWALSFVPVLFHGAAGGPVPLIGYAAVPVAMGIAILRYRLYDIDVVIRKALVVAVLAVFFTLVYALVVGGVGALVGSRSTSGLSFVAAAVAAIGFQPVLLRARRFADRVVYGKRATPYEVLAELGERLEDTYDVDDVLPRIARVLGEGVGAARAHVWLRVGDDLRIVATWPADADPGLSDDHRAEVRHQAEPLGALSVAMPPSDPMDPGKEKLIADLAGQAGLVLRNVRLTEQLRARLEDLKAAQKRLVTAQDQERRRLERNIHDGAQQQLVALNVQLGLLARIAGTDPVKAQDMAGTLQARATEALEDLRDLARGIYPPLLADKGLAAALEAQVRKAAIPVEVLADGVGRYPPEVEAAVYFSALEALQNVAKYAGASHVTVTLAQRDGSLSFSVADDGRGFDPQRTGYGTGLQGIADRLHALDGELEVTSRPGSGTVVRASVPVSTPAEVAG
jgi:signal transduction histidine kinase